MDFWFKKKTNKEIKKLLDNNNYTYFCTLDNKEFIKIIFKKNKTIFVEQYNKTYNELNIVKFNSFEDIKAQYMTMRYKNYLKYNSYKAKNIDIKIAIKKYAEKHYGEEFVEIINNTLTIHRPSIIIKSDNGLIHEIKDVYINLKISDYYPYQLKLENMKRATVTSSEFRENYIHSHYSGSYIYGNQEGVFCKGDNNVSKILDAIHNNKLSFLKSLPYYFYILDNYLEHESTEGIPYKLISNVKNNKNYFSKIYNTDLRLNYQEILKYSSYILNELSEINFNYVSYSKIELDENTIKEINEITKNIKTNYKFLSTNNQDVIVNKALSYNNLKIHDNKYVTNFKNKDIKFKIENTDPDLENEYQYKSLSSIQIEKIIKFIENKIHFNLWKKEYMK